MGVLLYGIIIIISIYIIVSFYSSKLKLRASLEYEKKEKKQIEELNQSKLRFSPIYHMNSVLRLL